jgi:hypothetical protein
VGLHKIQSTEMVVVVVVVVVMIVALRMVVGDPCRITYL